MKRIIVLSVLAIPAFSFALRAQIPLAEELVVVSNERGVNSEELEFSPVFYKDGIVFISTRHESLLFDVKDKNIGGKNIMSIYRAWRNAEGFLDSPQPFADELLFRLHEGPVTFDRTASTIFFTRNESQELAPDGYKKLQVYAAERNGEVWGNIQKLSFNDVNYNFCHPTISPDEDVIFISSDVPGGYGGMDLYAVFRTNGKWSQMINLGDKVNTPGNEVFPYISADKTLYFSSDGHGGFGNFDIFYTTQTPSTEEWRTPVNLGPPFNSPADDFGFIVDRDNKNGYFSSDREGGFGGDDIYKFYIENQASSPIAGAGKNPDGLVVMDENGNPLSGALVSAINFRDIPLSDSEGEVVTLRPGDEEDRFVLDVHAGSIGETAETGPDGKAGLTLRRGNYVIKVVRKGYLPQFAVITPETDLDKLHFTLQKAVDCISLKGRVLHEELFTPVSGAIVKITDVDTKETITIYADAKGYYEYCIDCNRTYSVYAEKNNVASAPGIVSTKGVPCNEANGEIELPLYLRGAPVYAGMVIRLPNIYFNFDDASLRPDAYRDLDEVVGLLNRFTGMKLELASHTDSRGSKAYNLDLSRRRSKSVLKYITNKGIASDRLKPVGYGESQIRNRCVDGVACTEAEHQYNRRTEIKILEMGVSPEGIVPVADVAPPSVVPVKDASIREREEKGKGGQATDAPSDPTPPVAIADGSKMKDEFSKRGNYAVIAGTFANHDYAVRRATLLMDKGFLEASIVKQERNGLFAVYVQTLDSWSEASSLVKKLDKHQIHAYVMKW